MDSANSTVESQSPVQKAVGGGEIQLVCIANKSNAQEVWWSKDGSILADPPVWVKTYNPDTNVNLTQGVNWNKQQYSVFVFQERGLADRSDILTEVPGADTSGVAWGNNFRAVAHNYPEGSIIVSALTPKSTATATVRIAVPDSIWTTAYSEDGTQFSSGSGNQEGGNGDSQWSVSISPTASVAGSLTFKTTFDVSKVASRIVGVGSDGKILLPEETSQTDTGYVNTETITFPQKASGDIRRLEYQIRPRKWLVFSGISLHPVTPGAAF